MFVCAGLAVMADLSFLLAPMVMGSVVANLSARGGVTFEAVEETESPLLALFSILAGEDHAVTDHARRPPRAP